MAYLSAIGNVANLSATFERALDICSLEIANISSIGFCLTSQIMGPTKKLDAYIAIAIELGPNSFANELNSFSKRTASISERRNRAIHDPWDFTDNEVVRRLEVTARRKLRHKQISVSPQEVIELLEELQAHTMSFVDLHEKSSPRCAHSHKCGAQHLPCNIIVGVTESAPSVVILSHPRLNHSGGNLNLIGRASRRFVRDGLGITHLSLLRQVYSCQINASNASYFTRAESVQVVSRAGSSAGSYPHALK